MKKLKTLKDLKLEIPEHPWYYNKEDEKDIISKKDLRQELIKWVKEFQKERTKAISEMFDNVDKHGIYPTTKFFNRIDNFWMKIFNIKEEDLK